MWSGCLARTAVAGLVLVGGAFLSTGTAVAACHAFEISVSPATVAEGGRVTVTVSRDAGVNPSSVDVSSVDGSARAGEDYEAVERTVSFTAETEQTFSVATVDNGVSEGSESFRLHLSNPDGCAVNPNFVVGPDATVTISDNDAAAPTTAPPSPPTTGAPTTAAATTAAPAGTTATTAADTTVTSEGSTTSTDGDTTTSEPSTTTTTAAIEIDEAAASDNSDDGGSWALVAAAIVAIIAVALAVGYSVVRRRTRPQE